MFEFLRRQPPRDSELPSPAYRLRAWPDLPDALRTAAVFQAFSRMSQGPVSLPWFIRQTRLRPDDARDLFEQLVLGGQLQVIELAGFRPDHSRQRPPRWFPTRRPWSSCA